MLSYVKSATARPGIKNGTTQLVNSWRVVKWADFQNKCSVPLNLIYTTTVVCEQDCDIVTLSDHLLRSVLNLLRREVSEHGRHLQQYFNLFVMYANLGKRSWALGSSPLVYVEQRMIGSVCCRSGGEDAAAQAERPSHVHAGGAGRGSRSSHQVSVRRARQTLRRGFAAGALLWRVLAHAVIH